MRSPFIFSKFFKAVSRITRDLFPELYIVTKMKNEEDRANKNVANPSDSFRAVDLITEALQKYEIVTFNKSWCPFCVKVEKIFKENKINFFSIYLDQMEEGLSSKMMQKLKEMTGQDTVPNVFIHRNHVGGCSDIQAAFATGTIYDMLSNTFGSYDYDLVVIGGGSGGLAAAKEAAQYGKKVAVIDYVTPTPKGTTWGLGGTCVNVGCIPKKLMHRAALYVQDMKEAENFGWGIENQGDHNWQKMVESIQNYILSLNWNYRKQLREKGINYVNDFAVFQDPHTIKLCKNPKNTTKKISAKNFIISVGCRPHYPDFPGAKEHCITSDDLFSLENFPGKTLLIGASYIALECAGFLQNLGASSTVMVRSILLRGFDRGMSEKIGEQMEKEGVKFLYNCVPIEVRVDDNEPSLYKVIGKYSNGNLFEDVFNTVILATGRNACTESLNLQEIGVALNPKNKKILVDAWDRTSVKTIFAIGDVAEGRPELTPVAIQAGKFLARRLCLSLDQKLDWNCIPTTVFTPLEYGCVGLSEEDAALVHEKEIEVFHGTFQPLEWALGESNSDCYAKLVCVPGQDNEMQVVGFHVLGPNAGEITQGFALALKLGATKKQFDELVGIHPTCAEVFTSLNITKSSGITLKSSGC